MVIDRVASDAVSNIVASITIIRTTQASPRDNLAIGPREASLVTGMITPKKEPSWTSRAVCRGLTGCTGRRTAITRSSSEILVE